MPAGLLTPRRRLADVDHAVGAQAGHPPREGPLDPTQDPGLGIGSYETAAFGDFASFDGLIDEVRISDTALSPSEFLSVPEPTFMGLFGLLGLSLARRRRHA